MLRTTFKKLQSSILVLLVLLAAACGHKAQVRAPQPGRCPAPSVPQPQPAQPQVQPPPNPLSQRLHRRRSLIPATIPSYPVPSLVPPSPSIRIGLNTSAKEVRISAPGNYYLLEKKPEAQRELISGEVRVRVEQEVDESSEVFRVQVASFARPEGADSLTRELERKFGLPVVVRESSAGLKQVRVGEFATREEALRFARADLADAGYRDVLVVRETTSSGGGEMTLALRGGQNLFRVSKTGFLFFPGSATAPLEFDGKPYRGLLDLTLNATSQITSVNQLGMEEYLLGVVPAEISPTAYPEFAALAAQSIAARTYALKNMGRFRSDGFDLTADTRSQVYTGLSGENDAANEAVRQTFGLAIYYQGKLIDAMYTSTCGGRTEDYSQVFDAPDVPYLRSVICAVESGEDGGLGTELSARHEWNQLFFADDGSLANRSMDLAQRPRSHARLGFGCMVLRNARRGRSSRLDCARSRRSQGRQPIHRIRDRTSRVGGDSCSMRSRVSLAAPKSAGASRRPTLSIIWTTSGTATRFRSRAGRVRLCDPGRIVAPLSR